MRESTSEAARRVNVERPLTHPLDYGEEGLAVNATRSDIDRFWAKVEKTDYCWLWTASTGGGYGRFMFDGKSRKAHRFAYELSRGPIPHGMELDHLCRNTRCVNPAHLEPVTHRENVLRGTGLMARRHRATHCERGHLFDGRHSNGRRICRTCRDASPSGQREYKQAKNREYGQDPIKHARRLEQHRARRARLRGQR